MNIVDIINKKRNKKELTYEELEFVINGFLNGTIKDYQISALLMAITINDMSDYEIMFLTNHMINSGSRLDLSYLGNVVDKHSTGGVGDKTTLIISPIVASCGVKVAKMSGRGLGHTGGTIDKLESIPGFNVNLKKETFINQVNNIGLAITSQTEDIALADKKLYALRDVTGTVESIPLIATSIMSKKIASGAKKLVIDLKVGKGALIKDLTSARRLAKIMIDLGKINNIEVVCLLTNMNIPLGRNIGNSLEVAEAMEILQNKKESPLKDLCIELATHMVSIGLNISEEESKKIVIENIENGKAYNKFLEFIKAQGGNIKKLPTTKYVYIIRSNSPGYLVDIDALKLAELSLSLGAGRITKEDKINYAAGIVLNKNINDYVSRGEIIMSLYTDKNIDKIDSTIFKLSNYPIRQEKLIYEIIR